MRSRPTRKALVGVLLLAAACAHVGPTADPAVVRAEDMLTNSLTIYTAAMNFHFANSTKESVSTYRTFEDFRSRFPIAWQAVDMAKRSYQADKRKGTAALVAAMNALSILVSSVSPLIGRT